MKLMFKGYQGDFPGELFCQLRRRRKCEIALMSDDISKVSYLKRLSNATVSTIKLSITLSMCINFVAIILSVTGILNPTTGALVHNAGSCFVVLIAALLYDRKFDD